MLPKMDLNAICIEFILSLFRLLDFAIHDAQRALCAGGNALVMGNQHNGVALMVKLLKQAHDLRACGGIQVAGGFIR